MKWQQPVGSLRPWSQEEPAPFLPCPAKADLPGEFANGVHRAILWAGVGAGMGGHHRRAGCGA